MSHLYRLNHWLSVIVVVSSMLLSACGSLFPPSRTYKIGVVTIRAMDVALNGFKTTLEDMNYIEGQNVIYIYEGPAGSLEMVESRVQHLLDAHVDLILAITAPAALAARQMTAGTDIPVVFISGNDPVEDRIVTSLSHPGGNLTGISMAGGEGKRLEWLHQLAPDSQRVYFPHDPRNPGAQSTLRAIQETAPKLGIELVPQEITSPEELDKAIENLPQNLDAIFIAPDTLMLEHADKFCQLALEQRIPLTTPSVYEFGKDGTLFTFGVDLATVGRQAARLADKIIQGTDAGQIPVETGEFFLSINVRTAQSIGLTIADTYLQQAHNIVR